MKSRFSDDPVLISAAIYTFVQAVVAVFLLAGWLSEVAGGVIVGITAAANVLVQQLVVKPATVLRQPLERLAASANPSPPP